MTGHVRDIDDLVATLAGAPGPAGLCLDFDGTLAAIRPDPSTVTLPGGLRPLLEGLASALDTVAIVSGRPAAFLGQQAAVPGVRLLGLYGLEEWRDGAVVARPEAAAWQDAVDRARTRLLAAVSDLDGVLVEDKGLSVAVHWRNSADRAAAERAVVALVDAVAEGEGLAVEPGKFVSEVRPPVDWDKGAAVRALAEEAALSRLVYVGDDLGDLPAFAATRALGGLAVAVEHGTETPTALVEAADASLQGHDEVAAFLTRLHHALLADSSDR